MKPVRLATLGLFSADSVIDLHPSGFLTSNAAGVSSAGQVGWANPIGASGYYQSHALFWKNTADTAVDLHAFLNGLGPKFIASSAASISENGCIVGVATDTSGQHYAVLWTPVPEPASCALIFCGYIFVSLSRGRRLLVLSHRRPDRNR
jgi:hypothetical protein